MSSNTIGFIIIAGLYFHALMAAFFGIYYGQIPAVAYIFFAVTTIEYLRKKLNQVTAEDG
jgi:hypothetical protein